jgi:hypothetical protein
MIQYIALLTHCSTRLPLTQCGMCCSHGASRWSTDGTRLYSGCAAGRVIVTTLPLTAAQQRSGTLAIAKSIMGAGVLGVGSSVYSEIAAEESAMIIQLDWADAVYCAVTGNR